VSVQVTTVPRREAGDRGRVETAEVPFPTTQRPEAQTRTGTPGGPIFPQRTDRERGVTS
jgi:hypothetical protein